MTDFEKKWEKKLQKIMEGDERINFHIIKNEGCLSVVTGQKIPIIHLIVYYTSKGESKLLGCYNGTPLNNQSVVDNTGIQIIVDKNETDDIKLLVKGDNFGEIYSSKTVPEDSKVKFVIFQESQYFASFLVYDPQISDAPAQILRVDEIGRKNLKEISLSYINTVSKGQLNNCITKTNVD